MQIDSIIQSGLTVLCLVGVALTVLLDDSWLTVSLDNEIETLSFKCGLWSCQTPKIGGVSTGHFKPTDDKCSDRVLCVHGAQGFGIGSASFLLISAILHLTLAGHTTARLPTRRALRTALKVTHALTVFALFFFTALMGFAYGMSFTESDDCLIVGQYSLAMIPGVRLSYGPFVAGIACVFAVVNLSMLCCSSAVRALEGNGCSRNGYSTIQEGEVNMPEASDLDLSMSGAGETVY